MVQRRTHPSHSRRPCDGFPLFLALCGAVIIAILLMKNWDKPSENRNGLRSYSKGLYLRFPPGFRWSVASSAYQTEGAVSGHGRGLSIWDHFLKKGRNPSDRSIGDVATDSYHRIEEDVRILKNLGVNQYRFSISWPRVLPNGLPSKVNKKGVSFYHRLISALLNEGIEPVVTLYHWDLPLSLGDRGGWLNADVVNWFGNYSQFCFTTFGERVKTWITLNEPHTQSLYGYCGDVVEHAPGGFKQNCEWTMYLAAHHMLLAHARAARLYKGSFQKNQKGTIGITLDSTWIEPASDTRPDRDAAEQAFQFQFGWFANPIFSANGNYPLMMWNRMNEIARKEGRTSSRLPTFTQNEIELLRGSTDFLGLNYYISLIASANLELNIPDVSRIMRSQKGRDIGVFLYYNASWPQMGPSDSWIRYHPEGLRKTLNYVKHNLGNIPILITENGCMDGPSDGLEDSGRIFYLKGHLENVWRAIVEDTVNVIGYTVWSLLDNFEWIDGYSQRFGLYHVQFDSVDRVRSPKSSAKWYKDVARSNILRL